MKEYSSQAKTFYKSKQWKKTRNLYLLSRNYLCERCGNPARLVHHKIPIDSSNINDTDILLSFDNLEALCLNCHNKEHFLKDKRRIEFDEYGNPILPPA